MEGDAGGCCMVVAWKVEAADLLLRLLLSHDKPPRCSASSIFTNPCPPRPVVACPTAGFLPHAPDILAAECLGEALQVCERETLACTLEFARA
jgi:hypothetical protein